MVMTMGNPNAEFKTPEIYPPTPVKKAPPRQTIPTKWARKSKLKASSAKIQARVVILCHVIEGATRGMINIPTTKENVGNKA
jgi:hypothetical protein